MPKRMQHLVGCQEMEIKMPSIRVSTTLVWSADKVDLLPLVFLLCLYGIKISIITVNTCNDKNNEVVTRLGLLWGFAFYVILNY